jgi:hypothetical protein
LDRFQIYQSSMETKHSLPVVTERFVVEIIIRAITATTILMNTKTTITTSNS